MIFFKKTSHTDPKNDEKILIERCCIAHHFFTVFLNSYVLLNVLSFWSKGKYRLPFLALAGTCPDIGPIKCSMNNLLLEMVAYGANQLSGGPNLSVVSFISVFEKFGLETREYKEARKKYINIESDEERPILFQKSAENILDSLDEAIKKSSLVKSKALTEREVDPFEITGILALNAVRSMEDISNWVLSLKENDIHKISSELKRIGKIESLKKAEKKGLALLESYGFGLKYFNKIKREMAAL